MRCMGLPLSNNEGIASRRPVRVAWTGRAAAHSIAGRGLPVPLAVDSPAAATAVPPAPRRAAGGQAPGLRAKLERPIFTVISMIRPAFFAALPIAFLAVAATALPALAADGPVLERIRSSGTVTFAYREGAAPFSFKDRRGKVHGYSVELCNRIAAALQKDLRLPALKVEWLPVDAARRIGAITGGTADLECGTTTITLTRMQSVDFSVPIFVDGGSVVVRGKSKLSRLADLKGSRIAVIGGTTTERALRRALDVIDAAATLVPVKDGAAGMAALAKGQVDGYAGDRVVLLGLIAGTPDAADFDFITGDFSVEPYALVLPRNDADFRLAVNRALVALFRSGEIDPIFQRWLGGLGQPSTLLHALFYLNTLPE